MSPPSVQYVGDSHLDPEICTRIDYICEPGWSSFVSECGCGCLLLE